jgi:hypothetical protein
MQQRVYKATVARKLRKIGACWAVSDRKHVHPDDPISARAT